MGLLWASHFHDACAAFGTEHALAASLAAPELFRAVLDGAVEFHLRAGAVFYEAVGDRLDAVLLGNDFAGQNGLLLPPRRIRDLCLPGVRRLVAQAKGYGLKVVYHSCGAVREIIPDLIACGVDALHPIEPRAAGMDAAGLRRDFGDRISFVGGVDAQHLLVRGAPEAVRAEVRRLKALFPTGLVVSPSNETLLPDIPPANLAAMIEAVRE
jgi:uroporphyrinogen decarboxylase